MDDPRNEEPAAAASESSPGQGMDFSASLRRRKVRKGTRSCWECKRRKIRCMLASPGDATCIGCQHRRVPCVPQELPGDLSLSPAKKDNQRLGQRIARVEKLMKDFLASRHDGRDESDESEPRRGRIPLGSPDATRPRSYESFHTSPEGLRGSAPNPSLLTPDSQDVSVPIDYPGLSDQAETENALHHLAAALPSEADVRILLGESLRSSRYTHLTNTQPHSRLTPEALAAPYRSAELPCLRPGMHPVMLARLMLTFAITLQSPSGEKAEGLSEPHTILARRLVTAARTWVTTKEAMHGSLECLICILLEGAYEVNCGNLRWAWAVYRRAMTVAQLMGLHRSPVPPVKRVDPELDADPEFIWFRIVYMDRYLSLLLSLPQGTSDKTMGAVSTLRHQPPLGKFERLLTAISSRILERNESPFSPSQISTTQSIDAELLAVSRSMPASFWRAPNFHNLTPGSPDTLLETLRLAAHVYYHGLLIQLHLPYMMRIGENSVHEYSKITSVNSSREIMTRFIAHRSFNPMSSCSRPVDFFALLAAMTLLLAHFDAHHHREATNMLAHQRLSDRAMLEQVLERMDVTRAINIGDDVISGKSAQLIRRLLEIEADAADGNSYNTDSVEGGDESKSEGEALQLSIPYLGVIKISRQGPISRELSVGNAASRPHQTPQAEAMQREPPGTSGESSTLLSRASLSDDLSVGHFPSPQLQAPWYGQSVMQCPSSSYDTMILRNHAAFPPIAAGINDWPFQGVDMAFFDGLIRGATCPDGVRLEP
ncbi:hypothetical protein B0I37DRAFT_366212 [Chaetomium sp. MPI-CAGE-AT-0009]|nr:hypothetical protein B0I37DRAFT_366212 [Chaetomium sp. MPI-CAGE-AT-0009]